MAISLTLPRVTPLPETMETQTRGGISITLAPTPFTVESIPSCSYGFATGFRLVMPTGVSRETHEHLEESQYEGQRVTPEGLVLLLTVRNQMDRVFRGAGSVVQFSTGGRVQGIEQSYYQEFLDALIVPRGETQLRIRGPDLSSIPEGSAMGVFLYDVPTATDAAGNVSNRENFEWYFTVTREAVEHVTEARIREVWVPNATARTITAGGPDGSVSMRQSDGRCLPNAVPDAIHGGQ